ncbi:MAG: hypothetical protein MJY90_00275 [Bacteroidaceae bacterium]|nr:hypothetical protein [Bacteroidaceae bacterium]
MFFTPALTTVEASSNKPHDGVPRGIGKKEENNCASIAHIPPNTPIAYYHTDGAVINTDVVVYCTDAVVIYTDVAVTSHTAAA